MRIIKEELGDGKKKEDPYIYIHSFSSNALTMIKILNSYDKSIIGFSHLLTKVRQELL